MNNNMLLSFVIPVYNTPTKYLDKCLKSLKELKNEKVEFLIIDDGSTSDKIIDVVRTFLDDKRFFYLKKENSGVSDTRNFGLKKSRGNYLFFLDSDDYINDFDFERILEIYNSYDIISFNASLINHKSKKIKKNILNSKKICGPGVVWGKIFKKDFLLINNISFDKNLKYGEDSVFICKCLSANPQLINFEKHDLYNYRVSNNHTTTNYNMNAFYDFDKTQKAMVDFVDINSIAQGALCTFYRYILKISFYNNKCHIKNKRKMIYNIINDDSYMFKDLFSRLPNIRLSLYNKVQFYLLRHHLYFLMYYIDKMICKLFKKI